MKYLLLFAAASVLLCACSRQGDAAKSAAGQNPFLGAYTTPYNVPPFDRITAKDFLPAFDEAIRRHNAEIEAIVANPEAPTFANTVAALADSGELLEEVYLVFDGLNTANTSPALQELDTEISPRLAAHQDEINLNPRLYRRVKAVYDRRADLGLDAEQSYLLENTYREFVRNGAALDEASKSRLKDLNQQLSLLVVRFTQNLLAETNDFKLVIDNSDDLSGLPEAAIATAAATAREAGLDGKWVFTTQVPSIIPFLQYSPKRDLREKLFSAYTHRGDNGNSHDNKKILSDIVKLRVERAHLLGYKSHADFVLETRMAKTPAGAYKLLNQVWAAALPVARREARELQAIIDKEGGRFKLQPWDWWYYAEKLRKEKYDLDDSELRPYFQLDHVRDGAFMVAHRLYGLNFEEITTIPRPHADARAFKVTEADGKFVGVLYQDFFPRASKQGGAWCGTYRSQSRRHGQDVRPVVTMVCNFTRPAGNTPALLSLDEVETLFHEFGHALDDLLANTTYATTFVATDFVELPSQIMEHWATEPEVLRAYARDYRTGAVIPDALIAKIGRSRFFNQGFQTVEYMAAALLDMKYHTLTEPRDLDIDAFEKATLDEIGLIPQIVSRYRSTYFNHICGWGYSAGYYSYIWSGVLDCDAFEAFKETGLFDPATAASFRRNILEENGTEDPMTLYKAFRGREPRIEPLLKDRGLM